MENLSYPQFLNFIDTNKATKATNNDLFLVIQLPKEKKTAIIKLKLNYTCKFLCISFYLFIFQYKEYIHIYYNPYLI